jgi:chromosome segregation ATPase
VSVKECLACGKLLPPRKKGYREREYCSDVCRQRASRKRNKWKHDLDRIQREANERHWNALDQSIHRETWQDELKRLDELNSLYGKRIQDLISRNNALERYIESLEEQLADKEAEIVRLNVLLNPARSRRSRPPGTKWMSGPHL